MRKRAVLVCGSGTVQGLDYRNRNTCSGVRKGKLKNLSLKLSTDLYAASPWIVADAVVCKIAESPEKKLRISFQSNSFQGGIQYKIKGPLFL